MGSGSQFDGKLWTFSCPGKMLTEARPLPRGEVRDMPADAKIHNSAIRRLENDPSYRPGNLICGGGGRGHITAPKEAGIGRWVIAGERGDVIGERFIREPNFETEEGNEAKTDSH